MIGICIPAHDEEALLGACLRTVAAATARVAHERTTTVVVADACSDGTAAIARAHGAHVIEIAARCVGSARDAGARWLLARGARWICCTDADSRVPPDWITAQLACGGDAYCGTIRVDDWQDHAPHVAQAFAEHYQARDGHRHIHGANLGICAEAYRRSGGFAAVPAHEDVGLVQALLAAEARITWAGAPGVVTSARKIARAPEGFAHWLNARERVAGAGEGGGQLLS